MNMIPCIKIEPSIKMIPTTLLPFSSYSPSSSDKIADNPTSATPPTIKKRAVQWCLYSFRFKKITDIIAVMNTISPPII